MQAYGALNEAQEAVALLQRAGGWAGDAAGSPVAQAPAYGAALVAAVRTFDTQAVAAIEVPACSSSDVDVAFELRMK